MFPSKRSGVILILASFAALFTFPFVGTLALNNLRLWNFERQLERADLVVGVPYAVLATGRQIFVAGNDEACMFRATRIFLLHGTQKDEQYFIEQLKSMEFNSAEHRDDGASADKIIFGTNQIIGIMVEDGPHSSIFDFRCW
jgi:hypothetical protein